MLIYKHYLLISKSLKNNNCNNKKYFFKNALTKNL